MPHRLYVLIDYDNLGSFRSGKSCEAVLRHIEAKIPDVFLEGVSHIDMRLYGGWVNGRALTRKAQTLSAELQAKFPGTAQRMDKLGTPITRIISASFARAGLFLPTEDILDTFMPNRTLGQIKIDQGAWRTCAAPGACPLTIVEDFVTDGQCAVPGCGVTVRDLIRKDEQKQVDTLLVADMAELALRKKDGQIVLVSSDADMWPGVLLCLTAGASVCQIHTSTGGVTKPTLRTNLSRLSATYIETSI